MRISKKNIKNILTASFVGLSVSSCSLDMLPLNEVVLENYWTNKSDVESVVTSCYLGMQEKGYVSDLIVWGEDRSDNVVPGPDCPSPLTNLMKGSLKTTSPYCDWSAMYNVINRCNTALYYAPVVAEKDPNYTESDLRINIAECKALRAISYLTLIKTFKDVPFSLQPSIDDNVEYRLPQTKFETILQALINDLDSCKDFAPRRYPTKIHNTAKITRAAMYAILSELYLWRASDANLSASEQDTYYRKCIECCDYVLDFKKNQYKENNIEDEDLTKTVDPEVYTKYGFPLLSEVRTNNDGDNAFNATFGTGNSFESIFEITYHYGSSMTTNEDLGLHYGGVDDKNAFKQYVLANENLITNAPTGKVYDNTTLFSVNTDFRTIEPFLYTENGSFDIIKYSSSYVRVEYKGTGNINYASLKNSTIYSQYGTYKTMTPNWIFYRVPEIMLFKAEAEIELAGHLSAAAETSGSDSESGSGSTGGSAVTANELYDDAFNLISAVYIRSNPAAETSTTVAPDRSKFTSLKDMESLLMNERRREFLFEGRRYFDLVRQARREGNTNGFISALTSKYGQGGAAVAIKMKQMDFMYMPVQKTQMQVNPNLRQNSAYLDEESIVNN